MKTFEELKQEAIARGIRPGVVIRCASTPSDIATVPSVSEWREFPDGFIGFRWKGVTMNRIYINVNQNWAEVITPSPEDQPQGLMDGMACEPDEHMRRAIVEKAKELGFWEEVNGSELGHNPNVQFIRGVAMGMINRNRIMGVRKFITPGEFYDRLCKTVKPELPIRIGGHDVVFNRGGIKVGCTEIPNDVVRKVYERLI